MVRAVEPARREQAGQPRVDPGSSRTVPSLRRRSPRAPLVPVALAFASGILVDRLGLAGGWGTSAWASLAIAAGGLVLAFAPALGRLRSGVLAMALLALGAAWHHHRWSDLPPDDLALRRWDGPTPAWVRGTVVEIPEYRPPEPPGVADEGFTRLVVAARAIRDGDAWRSATGGLIVDVSGDRTDLAMGQPIEAAGALDAIAGPRNPGEIDRRARWRAEGERLRLSVDTPDGVWPDPEASPRPVASLLGRLRTASHKRLVAGLPADVAPLAAALLLGRRTAIDPETYDAFARTGTMHLLAISGLHMNALAVILGILLAALGMGRKRAALLVLTATACYALLVGLRPSVVRALGMTAVVCLGIALDRPTRPANLLALAALATLAINPAYLFDVGCQLSFLAVAAIVWGVPPVARAMGLGGPGGHDPGVPTTPKQALDRLERRLAPSWRRSLRGVARGVALLFLTSAVVWLVTAPLIALRFHLLPWIGLLGNMVLVPLSMPTLATAGLALVGSALWPPLGAPWAWACAGLLRLNVGLVQLGASWRGGHVFTPGPPEGWVAAAYVLLALAAWAVQARRGLWLKATSLLLAAAWLAIGPWLMLQPKRPPTLEAEVLAVDHGLAVLVRAPSGRTLLYDCGRMRDRRVGRRVVVPALWARGVRRLDAVVLSHADADHYNGLPDVLDRVPIGVVRVPPGFGDRDAGAGELLAACRARGVPVEPIAEGGRLDLGPGVSIAVLHPPEAWEPAAPDNARSVVLDLAADGRHLLLTGDLEGAGLDRFLDRPARADALLAPHHGGRTANPRLLYEATRPGLVIASQRRPIPGTRDALEWLEESDSPARLLRTWRSGAVRLVWARDNIAAQEFIGQMPEDFLAIGRDANSLATIATSTLTPPRWLIATVAFLAGLAACVVLAVIEWGAWALVTPGRRTFHAPGPAEPAPWEPITQVAADGARLAGASRAAASSCGRTAILLHGFAEDRGALLGRAEALAARGWNVAILDHRGRGASGGPFGTFGAREAEDVRGWLDALAGRAGPGFAPVLWGRSMGAAVALRAAALDDRVRALVLEAPYSDLRPTVAAGLRRRRLPAWLARPMLRRAARIVGTPLDRPRPIDVAPAVHIPVLILLGLNDHVAPRDDVRRLAAAFPTPPEIIEVPGAHHHDVFDVGGLALVGRIVAFLERAAEPRENESAGSAPATPGGEA
jgi:competence protein ComEC